MHTQFMSEEEKILLRTHPGDSGRRCGLSDCCFLYFQFYYNAGQGGELQVSHIFFSLSLSETAEQNFTVIRPE